MAPDVMPYTKSKTLAERAAWDFISREGAGLELAVVNPVGVFGPVLGPDYATSILLVQRMLDGGLPGVAKDVFRRRGCARCCGSAPAVDDESCGEGGAIPGCGRGLHVDRGDRKVLKARLGDAAKRVPTRQLPNWLVKLAALQDPAVKQILPELGKWKNASSEKAQRVLGWSPRSREDSVLATAESMIRLGLVKSQ